jgi:hypothetical protein
VRVERLRDDVHDHIGEQILSPDLHHARRDAGAGRQDCGEVEVGGSRPLIGRMR